MSCTEGEMLLYNTVHRSEYMRGLETRRKSAVYLLRVLGYQIEEPEAGTLARNMIAYAQTPHQPFRRAPIEAKGGANHE